MDYGYYGGRKYKNFGQWFIDNKEIIKTKDMINLVYANNRFIESDILILGTKMDQLSSIIQLVNKSLNNNKIQNLDCRDEWGLLFNEAVSHQIHLLIFNNAVKCHDIPKELHEKWFNIYRLSFIRSIFILSILPGLFEKFNENKLSVILLKGPYLRDLYPEPDTRIMGDIDLFVDKMQLNETVNVINSFGYIMVEDDPTICIINLYIKIYTNRAPLFFGESI